MIIYFADRQLNILGSASTNLPDGLMITDDLKTEDVETGVSVFDCKIPYTKDTRADVERYAEVGNYILRSHNGENEFYTIIESENDTKKQELYIYAEDAGLDLLNDVFGAYAADKAYPIDHYINLFAAGSGFQIGINEAKGLSRKLSWDGEATATERLASVATQFDGCEISYTFDVDGLYVVRKYINVYKTRGKDVGTQLRLNFDIDSIVTSKSINNIATALLCTGGTPEDTDTTDDVEPEAITLKGYTYDDGDFYVDSAGVLKSRTALQRWSRYLWRDNEDALEGGHIVKPYSYDTLNQSTLCARAITELKKLREMEVNYTAQISKLPEDVRIGDRVTIIDDAGELYVSARVLKLETSVTNQEHEATFGEYLIKSSGIHQKVAELAANFAAASQSAARALQIAANARTAAQAAQSQADAAAGDAAAAQESAGAAEQAAENASKSAQDAQQAAETAETKATESQQAAVRAEQQAGEAATAAGNAQTTAQQADAKADTAKSTAEQAKAEAEAAATTAAAAKQDAEQARQEVDGLGENLTTLENTMQANYARKTDLTETEASLQTQITQNAAQISSTASKVTEIDETANSAASQAAQAQSSAQAAQAQADQATADAEAAQQAADNAAAAAQAAQGEANTAKAAAATAQTAADEADAKAAQAAADLATAQQNLADVTSRVGATEEEVEAAKAAVTTAQNAANAAQTNAAAAQATADTAKANAATAQTAADNAKAAADNAQAAAEDAQAAADKAQEDVDALAVRVTTAETNITQNAEQIALRATKTEVAQTLAGYYTKTEADAALNVKANEITQNVSSTYTTKAEFNALEVGGRNLLKYTEKLPIVDSVRSETAISRYTTANQLISTEAGIKFFFAGNAAVSMCVPLVYDGCIENGETITLSFDYRGNITDPGTIYFEQRTGANRLKVLGDISSLIANETAWQHYEVTFSISNINSGQNFRILLFYNLAKYTAENWIEIRARSLKLEKGTVATDWTPAPEEHYAAFGSRNRLQRTDASKYLDEWLKLTASDTLTMQEDGFLKVTPIGTAQRSGVYPPKVSTLENATEYTLSFEAYADAEQSINYIYIMGSAGNRNIAGSALLGTTPKKYTITFTAIAEYVGCSVMLGIDAGTGNVVTAPYYVKNLQVEKGNRATDWTPAPEDVTETIEASEAATHELIAEQQTSIVSTCESMILSAAESLVSTGEYDTFRQEVEAQLSILSDEITMNFTGATERISNVDGELQSFMTQFSKYIKFASDTAITIGSGDNTITLEIDNETGIIFSKNGVPFGSWDGVDFHTGNIVVDVNERAQLGNFAFIPRSDGSLSFLKVGG